jgi:hypothetical protein
MPGRRSQPGIAAVCHKWQPRRWKYLTGRLVFVAVQLYPGGRLAPLSDSNGRPRGKSIYAAVILLLARAKQNNVLPGCPFPNPGRQLCTERSVQEVRLP